MTPETKEIVLRALQNYRGDDLERAEIAAKRMRRSELDKRYSNHPTCRERLMQYRKERARVESAIAEVTAM